MYSYTKNTELRERFYALANELRELAIAACEMQNPADVYFIVSQQRALLNMERTLQRRLGLSD